MAGYRSLHHPVIEESPGIPPRASGRAAQPNGTPHHLRQQRSATSLSIEEHRSFSRGSHSIREQRSLVALRPQRHLEEQREQVQQLKRRERAATYNGSEDSTNSTDRSLILASAHRPEPERSKFFVRTSGLPSSWVLARGPILSNAVFSNPSGKLYEFVFPLCYKPVLLRPSFWQKAFKFPEYHVVLLDAERYMIEPIVVLRETREFASPDDLAESTGKDERALHIASCYREQIVLTVQNELQKRSKFCADGLEKAQKIKKKHYDADRDAAKRDRMRRYHKLMQIAADCAGDNGARGATWLFERLVRYFEFIGKKDGDEVVVRAAQLLVVDIQNTAKQTDISLEWVADEAAAAAAAAAAQ